MPRKPSVSILIRREKNVSFDDDQLAGFTSGSGVAVPCGLSGKPVPPGVIDTFGVTGWVASRVGPGEVAEGGGGGGVVGGGDSVVGGGGWVVGGDAVVGGGGWVVGGGAVVGGGGWVVGGDSVVGGVVGVGGFVIVTTGEGEIGGVFVTHRVGVMVTPVCPVGVGVELGGGVLVKVTLAVPVGVIKTGVVLGPGEGAPVPAGVGLEVPPERGGWLPTRVGVKEEGKDGVVSTGKPLAPAPSGSKSRKMSRLISGTRRVKESTL
ncbi:MAG: hypothetical protein A2Z49_09480 [Chloroflexi bacterium RBG_19FT_COMBO_56_12]|nr:MAG: hypothetical protein A2Z49_09480 [Chloroflexi bacterium RBG_19FT_COMBO_56_12]